LYLNYFSYPEIVLLKIYLSTSDCAKMELLQVKFKYLAGVI